MIKFSLRQLIGATTIIAALSWLASYLLSIEESGAIILIWLTYAGFSAFMTAPIVILSRKRVHWRLWETLAFVLPFVSWMLLMFSDRSLGKSLANLGEPFYFAFATPVVALIRVALVPRLPETAVAMGALAILCFVAAGTFFVVPSLPE